MEARIAIIAITIRSSINVKNESGPGTEHGPSFRLNFAAIRFSFMIFCSPLFGGTEQRSISYGRVFLIFSRLMFLQLELMTRSASMVK